MIKHKYLLLFLLMFSIHLNAQSVWITSAQTIPVSVMDTQHIKAVVATMFSSGNCTLLNSGFYVFNDSVYLQTYYEIGLLAVICNSTDTFDLNILPCTVRGLHVQATIVAGGAATTDATIPLNIGCTTTGWSEKDYSNETDVFPNPVRGELFIRSNKQKSSKVNFSILNWMGEIMYSSEWDQLNKDELNKIPVRQLPQGFYFLMMEYEDGIVMKKFFKSE